MLLLPTRIKTECTKQETTNSLRRVQAASTRRKRQLIGNNCSGVGCGGIGWEVGLLIGSCYTSLVLYLSSVLGGGY